LRTQTHLNEQAAEKKLIETELYPQAANYTDVYRRDGLLDHQCIAAHCIHMSPAEWRTLVETGSAVAHCPTSNLLLGSGLMSLDRVCEHRIPYAICTDMGASPTVSMLAEMRRFIQVHRGITARATPSEALWRSTLAPAMILGLEAELGRLEPGRPASFIEVSARDLARSADEAIAALLPEDPDDPPLTVARVTIAGKTVYERSACHA
jgi:guanine deaminase